MDSFATPEDPPRPALLLGPAGLIPFAALAAAALLAPAWRGWALPALLAYGACIAAFLGAVHWGLALRAPTAEAGAAAWARLGLGVLPALVAWVALLLPLRAGLVLLALLLVVVAAVEHRAAGRGLVPPGYLRLRWALSLGAAACLLLGWLAA